MQETRGKGYEPQGGFHQNGQIVSSESKLPLPLLLRIGTLYNVIFFFLSSNLGELLALILAIWAIGKAPLLAVQIVWVSLIMDTTGAIPLGLELKFGDELIVFRLGVFRNRWLVISIAASILLQLAVIYVPFFKWLLLPYL